jgi:hypothetical protein
MTVKFLTTLYCCLEGYDRGTARWFVQLSVETDYPSLRDLSKRLPPLPASTKQEILPPQSRMVYVTALAAVSSATRHIALAEIVSARLLWA